MCGIVGLIGFEDLNPVSPMNGAIAHRGPDDAGQFVDQAARVALAMRRLSIIDLASGHQPMTNEDGTVWIVFNGEIYNAPTLRPGLETHGHRFTTANSDTEVLLHLYEDRGIECLQAVNGMFAFMIYDQRRELVFGARDRMGIKPLYYWHNSGRLACASELKSLLHLPEVGRDVNLQSLYHYMTLLYVPEEASILRSIRRLPPAHWFVFDLRSKALSVERYWRPTFEQESRSEDEWVAILRHELRQAVERWTLSDVPVACSLSGGLDSTAIVGLLAEAGYPHIKTYTLGFIGADENEWDETRRARLVAERYATEHHEFYLEPDDLLQDMVSMVWHLDEPYAGGLPSWYVFREMSKDVKVGLTGTGGDELFGNYGKWDVFETNSLLRAGMSLHNQAGSLGKALANVVSPLAAVTSHLPPSWPWIGRGRALSRVPRMFHEPFGKNYYANDVYMSDQVKMERVFQSSLDGVAHTSTLLQNIYDAYSTGNARNGVAAVDLQTQLAEEFLFMTDRFSMAHSLEARTPFLDHTLVETVFRIPSTMRTRSHDLKYLFKRAVGDLLSPELMTAPKSGFVIPVELWLRGPLLPLVRTLLEPKRLREQGVFRPDFMTEWVNPHLDGRANHTWQIWAALMFQLWHVVYIEQACQGPPSFGWKDLI